MENTITEGLKSFDAFPKVAPSYSIRSRRGGIVTLALTVVCLFLIWVEMAHYIGGNEIQQFGVVHDEQKNMQINLDIRIESPCDTLTVIGMDQSQDKLLASELLNFEEIESIDFESGLTIEENQANRENLQSVLRHAKRSGFKKSRTMQGGPACRIYGSFETTRVKGELAVVKRIYGMTMSNFSHIIDELSFGDFYPKLVNPLDGVESVTDRATDTFQYFISIVPTTYQSYSTGFTVETNQYAVTEKIDTRPIMPGAMPPGIFFKYDIEPISLLITVKRMPFTQFLTRLVTIMGGIVVCTSWLYKAYDHTASKIFKRRGGEELERGMLDVSEKH